MSSTGYMPSGFKRAVITPLPKKPKRPLEKVIAGAVMEEFHLYCDSNGLVEPMQLAYKKQNCTDAIIGIMVTLILLPNNASGTLGHCFTANTKCANMCCI